MKKNLAVHLVVTFVLILCMMYVFQETSTSKEERFMLITSIVVANGLVALVIHVPLKRVTPFINTSKLFCELEVFDIWESKGGHRFVKVNDYESVYIGKRGGDLDWRAVKKEDMVVRWEATWGVKKIGKAVFN